MSASGPRSWLVGITFALLAFGVAPPRALGRPSSLEQGIRRLEERLAALAVRSPALRSAKLGVGYILRTARRLRPHQPPRARAWLRRASVYIGDLERGQDPYARSARGQITLRAYRSELSTRVQGFSVYVPPDYSPERRYPLLVALHGGSTNGNLFLALNLGARVPRVGYRDHWYAIHEPVERPDWIVVAPDGFGNAMWRWMGERDVLDVLDLAHRHYAVDLDRVVLTGMSNGGLGAFNIGLRHAWRFSAVVPMAGAPGWHHYLHGFVRPAFHRRLAALSGWTLLPHARLTHLHVHHGRRDPGPMRPRYIVDLARRADREDVPVAIEWYGAGHDLVRPVHRRGGIFVDQRQRRRRLRPPQVELLTGDYRANRQAWVEVTRIRDYPAMGRVQAAVKGPRVEVQTDGVYGLRLLLDAAPLPARTLSLIVDGQRLGPVPAAPVSLHRPAGAVPGARWVLGPPAEEGLVKAPGRSGPLPDAYFERLVHVYGTQRPRHIDTLRTAARRGARSWVSHVHGFTQPVRSDVELTPTELRSAHLVLYGTPADNLILARMADALPIRATAEGILLGRRLLRGRGLVTRYIYPNPLSPGKYVIVQSAPRPESVLLADHLPAFLPDFIVCNAASLRKRAPLGLRLKPRAAGYFDDRWRLVDLPVDLPGAPRPAPRPAPPAPRQPYQGQPRQPYQGQRREGAPYQGQRRQPYRGQPYQGRPRQPYQGRPREGAPYQGQPYQGRPYQGQPREGAPYQGQRRQPYQGAPYQGQPYQGQPYQGQPYQGQPYQGRP